MANPTPQQPAKTYQPIKPAMPPLSTKEDTAKLAVATAVAAEQSKPVPWCTVQALPDGEAAITVRIDAQTWKRLQTRIHTADPAEFVYNNCLKQAFSNFLY